MSFRREGDLRDRRNASPRAASSVRRRVESAREARAALSSDTDGSTATGASVNTGSTGSRRVVVRRRMVVDGGSPPSSVASTDSRLHFGAGPPQGSPGRQSPARGVRSQPLKRSPESGVAAASWAGSPPRSGSSRRGSPNSTASSPRFATPRERRLTGTPGSAVEDSPQHAATLLANGQGWHHISQSNFRPVRRHSQSAETFRNLIITYGGVSDAKVVGDMWLFDTNNVRWIRFDPVDRVTPGRRTGHATCIVGADMYLFGGETGLHTDNALWKFSLELKRWTLLDTRGGDAPRPRFGHQMVNIGRSLVVFGGADRFNSCYDDLWVFDLDTRKWTAQELFRNRPCARHGHSLCAVADEIILFGGFGGARKGKLKRLQDAWSLDPTTFTWTEISRTGAGAEMLPWPSARVHHSCSALNSKIIMFGGQTDSGPDNGLWEFDVIRRTWSTRQFSRQPDTSGRRMAAAEAVIGPTKRHSHAAVAFRGTRVFFWGGRGVDGKDKEDMWFVYLDPATDDSLNMSLSLDHSESLRASDDRLGNVQESLDRDLEAIRERLDTEHEERVDAETLNSMRWQESTKRDAARDERIVQLERRLRQWQLDNNPQAMRERIDKLSSRIESGIHESKEIHQKSVAASNDAQETLITVKDELRSLQEVSANQLNWEEENARQLDSMRAHIKDSVGKTKKQSSKNKKSIDDLRARLRDQREMMEHLTAEQAAVTQEKHEDILRELQSERQARQKLETRVSDIESAWQKQLKETEIRLEETMANQRDRDELQDQMHAMQRAVGDAHSRLREEMQSGFRKQSKATKGVKRELHEGVEERLSRIRDQIGMLLGALESKGEEEEHQLEDFIMQIDRTNDVARDAHALIETTY